MDPIVINVIVWVFVWPEFILSIDAVEANVWFVSMAVGEFTNVTFAIGAGFTSDGTCAAKAEMEVARERLAWGNGPRKTAAANMIKAINEYQ